MADTLVRRSTRNGFTTAETVIALAIDLLSTILATSTLMLLRDPTKDPVNQENPCHRLTCYTQFVQSMDLSSDGQYARFGDWKAEIYLAASLIRAIHNATHPIDLQQTILAFWEFINKHQTTIVKEPAQEYSPYLSLQISEVAVLQEGHLTPDH